MRRLQNLPRPFKAVAFSSLASVVFLNACGGLRAPDATPPRPPPVIRPCDVPFREKAAELDAQVGVDQPLDGSGLVELMREDAARYNSLFPKFNENLDWVAEHCAAKPVDPGPDSK